MSENINVTIYDQQSISVIMEDEQPISVTIEDEQPIQVMIEEGTRANDIFSNPPSGCYKIVNIYLNASKHIVIVYDETPVS